MTQEITIIYYIMCINNKFNLNNKNCLSTNGLVAEWDTLAMMKLWRREVVSSIPDRGTIVG